MQKPPIMKKQFLIALFFLSLTNLNVNCQTFVPGGAVSGTWTLSGSPYFIQGAILIPNDSILTINPGVIVNFQGKYLCLVLGRILALGTIQDSITFTSSDTATGWQGIRFDNTTSSNDTSKFIYCKFEYGKATGSSPNNQGGAIYFDNFSKTIISNSLLKNCLATQGGAIYCYKSSPIIKNNMIINNKASSGAGIYCNNGSNPFISNNIITYNSGGNGAGIYSYNDMSPSSPTIINNTISYNSGNWGGGIRCVGTSSIITHNVISYNSGGPGGGIFTTGSENISENIISNNISTTSVGSGWGGGGLFCAGNETISNNFISNNSATPFGGGICCYHCNSSIVNNVITNNTGQQGGGVFSTSYSSIPANPNFLNNTISKNLATFGGALYFTSSSFLSTPNFRNTIFWGDSAGTGNEVYINDQNSKPNFYYCNMKGGSASFGLNTNVFYLGAYINNIDSNPMFISPSNGCGILYDGLIADWSLQATSSCINAGDPNGSYPAYDIVNNTRVIGSFIDIGAFEYQDPVGIPNYNYQNQLTVYPNPFSFSTTLQVERLLTNAKLTLYNPFGQLVKQINNISDQTIVIERGNLSSGIYFLHLSEHNKTLVTSKVIITDN